MVQRQLRIGTRGSDLARWQANHISSLLSDPPEIIIIKTAGDRIQHLSLDKVEGKGFFTKEIEEELLASRVDVAVHSYKDLPTDEPEGLTIAAVPPRAPVQDALIIHGSKVVPDASGIATLPKGAKVGTSSLRRKAHLLSLRPDLNFVDLRGNVPTRFNKAVSGELDAVILAYAGMHRLGMLDDAAEKGVSVVSLDIADMCPAPAQGALAIQIRRDDDFAREIISALHDPSTAAAVNVERALLSHFGGGCHLPLGAHATLEGETIHLRALVAAPDGNERIEAIESDTDPKAVVAKVHAKLVAAGAEKYL